jgi:hypothetical protein
VYERIEVRSPETLASLASWEEQDHSDAANCTATHNTTKSPAIDVPWSKQIAWLTDEAYSNFA